MAKIPFKVYTDPSLELYDALGLYKTSDVQTVSGHSKRGGRWMSFRSAVRAVAAKATHNDVKRLGGEFVFGQGYCNPPTIDGMMTDLIFISDGRLKSSFVHKMQSPRDRAPIVEILEAAGVEVHGEVMARGAGVGSPTSTAPSSEVVDIDMTTSASTPELPQTPTSTEISFASVTSSTAKALTYSDDEDMKTGLRISTRVAGPLGSEPPTPIIEDEAEWMTHRTQSLMKIKQKREARRRGMS